MGGLCGGAVGGAEWVACVVELWEGGCVAQMCGKLFVGETVVGSCVEAVAQHYGRSCSGKVCEGSYVGGSYSRAVAQLYRGPVWGPPVCVGAVFGGAVAGSSGGLGDPVFSLVSC